MSIDSRPATRCSAMRLSSWFLCPTLRLLPEASHQVRNRLLFRVARTARKRGVGFVLRAQREPLPPLEAFGVELAWVSWGPPMARSPVARLCARLPVEKRAASFRWVCTEERFCVGGNDDPRLPSTYVRSLSTPERTDDFYDELFPGGKYTRVVQGTPSKTSAGTFRFSSDRRSTLLFRRSTLST